jgi:hypothetical protein
MAHLPLNKDPVLIYQKRTNISAYLPLPWVWRYRVSVSLLVSLKIPVPSPV